MYLRVYIYIQINYILYKYLIYKRNIFLQISWLIVPISLDYRIVRI